MIKLNSNEGRTIVRNYISALNGDSEDIKWANDIDIISRGRIKRF